LPIGRRVALAVKSRSRNSTLPSALVNVQRTTNVRRNEVKKKASVDLVVRPSRRNCVMATSSLAPPGPSLMRGSPAKLSVNFCCSNPLATGRFVVLRTGAMSSDVKVGWGPPRR